MAVQARPHKAGHEHPAKGRVLADASHGHTAHPGKPPKGGPGAPQVPATTRFGYMFDDLAEVWPVAHLPIDDPDTIVAALKQLGAAMAEPALPADPLTQPDNSVIPPVYTYWGQFIDHDMTLNTDANTDVSNITTPPFVPRDPAFVAENLRNRRHPALNLDSVYGDGPTFNPAKPTAAKAQYIGIKFDIGQVSETPLPGKSIPGDHVTADGAHDLPRDDVAQPDGTVKIGVARVADARNDENLVLAQLHVAFLRFHNGVVDWVKANEPHLNTDRKVFNRARQLVQWHYQWLVVHDFLETMTVTGMPDRVLFGDDHVFDPPEDDVFMPLEYSVAAYRFGHSMVRAAYDYNRNFGRPGKVVRNAAFVNMFHFTGKATPPFRGGSARLPFNWVIEWDRFVDRGSPVADHFARKIDTQLAAPLHTLLNEGNTEPDPLIKVILKSLATRNLLRGYSLGIPTGQQVAVRLGVEPLTEAEIRQGNSPAVDAALDAGDFLGATPLWYYVLKEAEVRANGNSLGEVGSRIVCETIIGQIRVDEESYLSEGWSPQDGVKLDSGDPIVSIGDLLEFAGVMEHLPL